MSNVRFIGLDVHAETIAVAVAEPNGEARSLGVIPNRPESIGSACSSAPSRSRVRSEERHMVTTDPYEDGAEETRQDFKANDFRITRALDSLLVSAKSIKGDPVSAEDVAARVHTLRHLLKQVGHDV